MIGGMIELVLHLTLENFLRIASTVAWRARPSPRLSALHTSSSETPFLSTPAEALETMILPRRCSLAVRLTASVLEGIAGHVAKPSQKGIESSKSSARGFLLAGG